jgi:hypothetical protein
VAGFIYALPAPDAPPPAPIFVQTDVIWTGWDGSKWDLTNPATGVVLLRDGVEGLHMPKLTEWTRKSPAVHGQTFAGYLAEPRKVVFPVLVFVDETDSTGEWIARDRAFWKSLHPAKEGTITISPAGAGSKRTLKVRLVPSDHQYPTDPAIGRWATYVIDLVADQPFWKGQTVTAGWSEPVGDEFYEENGPQLVNIAAGHTTADAAIRNDGDEPGWPVWTLIGPSTAAHMGVGDAIVEVPFTVAAGKAVVLDTDPRVRTAMEYDYAGGTLSNPVDRTEDLTGATDFAPIPPGETQPINISITGTGTIRVELTPLYWRAW